jgi:hypothetical protein
MSPRRPTTPIPRRLFKQDHNTPRGSSWTSIEPLQSLYARASSPWQSQPPSPWVTVRNIPPAILHSLQSLSKLLRHPRNLTTVEHFSSPIMFIAGIHFPPVLLHNQGYPKVCPDPLNLPNTGDPLLEHRRYLPILCFPRPGT